MDEPKRAPPPPLSDPDKPPETATSFTPSAETLAMIERAARAMADRKRVKRPEGAVTSDSPPPAAPTVSPPEPLVAGKPPQPFEPSPPTKSAEAKLVEEFNSLLRHGAAKPSALAETKTSPPETVPAEASGDEPMSSTAAALRPLFDDQYRLSFTPVQSAGIAVAIVAFVVGACGVAAQTWVSAIDWGCRTSLTTKYCAAPPPAEKPTESPAPLEIPN